MTDEAQQPKAERPVWLRLAAATTVSTDADGCVRIDQECGRSLLLRGALPDAERVLRGLDGCRTVQQVLTAAGAERQQWWPVLHRLRRSGLLVDPQDARDGAWPPGASGIASAERAGMEARYGLGPARPAGLARADALVLIRGRHPATADLAAQLRAGGVGQVHLALRTTRHTGNVRTGMAALYRPDPAGHSDVGARSTLDPLADKPLMRASRPATNQPPTLVILVSGVESHPGPHLLWDCANLLRQRIPVLHMTIGAASAGIGPLALPGRSACLLCLHRHRTDSARAGHAGGPLSRADAGSDRMRPIEESTTSGPPPGPVSLTALVAAAGATEALTFLDGVVEPVTVDGTVHWRTGDVIGRRRSWARHPECPCAGIPRVDGIARGLIGS